MCKICFISKINIVVSKKVAKNAPFIKFDAKKKYHKQNDMAKYFLGDFVKRFNKHLSSKNFLAIFLICQTLQG